MTNSPLAVNIFKKSIWIYTFTLLIAPLGYIIKIKLTSELSVIQIGMLYGMFSLAILLQNLNDFGVGESTGYFLPKHLAKKEYGKAKGVLLFSCCINSVMGAICGIIWFFLSHFIGEHYFQSQDIIPLLQTFSWYFILVNFNSLGENLLNITQHILLQKSIQFLKQAAIIAGFYWIFQTPIADLGEVGMVWIITFALSSIVLALTQYLTLYRTFFRNVSMEMDWKAQKEYLKYALGILLTAHIGTILHQADSVLITGFLGAEMNGYYSMYLSIIGIPFIFLTPLLSYIYPIISSLAGKEEYEKITLLRNYLERIFSVIGGLFGIGLFVFAKPIMLIIFGEKYLPSAPILQASSLFIVVNFLLQIRLIILAGIGGTRARIHIFTIGIFYNLGGIIAAIVLGKLLIGSYWATVVCAGVVGISWIPILLLAGKKIQQFNISLPWNTIMSQIVILGCGIFFGGAFSYFEIAQSRLELFILIILTMITTLGGLIWMNKDELLQLKKSLMK